MRHSTTRGLRIEALAALAAVLAVVFVPVCLGAQVIRGRVVAQDTREALSGAEVRVSGPEGVVDRTLTGEEGGFRLEVPGPGEWRITAELIGYGTLPEQALTVGPGEELIVELRMAIEPLEIDEPLVVVAERAHVNVAIQQYHRRREHGEQTGMGHFIHGEALERRGSMRPSDVLRAVPGLHTAYAGPGAGQIVRMRAGCVPAVYLDGMHLNRMSWRESLDNHVSTREIEGIEVYRGAMNADGYVDPEGCGIIMVWTKNEAVEDGGGFSLVRWAVGLGLIVGILMMR